jgi:hypothetical protein
MVTKELYFRYLLLKNVLTIQEDASALIQGEVEAGPTRVSQIFDQHLCPPSQIRQQNIQIQITKHNTKILYPLPHYQSKSQLTLVCKDKHCKYQEEPMTKRRNNLYHCCYSPAN